MRTHTNSGITIGFPDDFVLTGNRNIVSISGATAYDEFKIFGDTRELIAGVAEFDLSPYLMALFSTEAKNAKFEEKTTEQGIFFDGSASSFLDMEFTQVFYGKNRPLFARPFYSCAEFSTIAPWFEFWMPAEADATINGAPLAVTAGLNVLDLSSYTEDVNIVFPNVFDETFDETFPDEDIRNICVKFVSCPENGTTLRWLDSFGLWQQKNFGNLNTALKGTGNSFNWAGQTAGSLYRGLQFAEKRQNATMDMQAQSCNLMEALRLAELATADFVHYYDTATSGWLPCVIATNEIQVNFNRPSQNINLSIVLQNES